MKIIHLIIIPFLPVFSFGQLTLGGSDVQDLVLNALSGQGVSISNIDYVGAPEAISYFQANSLNSMPFLSGFVMTTGHKNYVVGPNNLPNAGVDNTLPGSSLMNIITGSQSFDATIVSFDLIPFGDTLRIKFIFGSEEYPEFVGTNFNDGFAIFISGPGISGTENIARLPNYSTISVNAINAGNPDNSTSASNYFYFLSNGNGNQAPYNSEPSYLQFDGLTRPILGKINVIPNQSYHIKMVIVDGGDEIFDSGVFIEEGGITASVSENNLSNFVNVFYSASNQQATIQITDYQENLTYSIVDLSGKVMTQSKITETTFVDMSNYSSGMYLIQVEGSNGKITKKVIR